MRLNKWRDGGVSWLGEGGRDPLTPPETRWVLGQRLLAVREALANCRGPGGVAGDAGESTALGVIQEHLGIGLTAAIHVFVAGQTPR